MQLNKWLAIPLKHSIIFYVLHESPSTMISFAGHHNRGSINLDDTTMAYREAIIYRSVITLSAVEKIHIMCECVCVGFVINCSSGCISYVMFWWNNHNFVKVSANYSSGTHLRKPSIYLVPHALSTNEHSYYSYSSFTIQYVFTFCRPITA